MFKLIRLAVYGLVGYALYQFVTDVIDTAGDYQQPRARRNKPKASTASKTSGKQKGGAKSQSTHDVDGGSTRHRVGRGVV